MPFKSIIVKYRFHICYNTLEYNIILILQTFERAELMRKESEEHSLNTSIAFHDYYTKQDELIKNTGLAECQSSINIENIKCSQGK